MVKKGIVILFVAVFSVFVFTNCGSQSQKDGDQTTAPENVISEELHQAHCDLLAEANEELANINQKVRDLNDKLREKGGTLSDAQNSALDEFEAKQSSINKRMHEIKNVQQEDWESFKTTFENDLKEIHTLIDEILAGF